MRMDIGRFKEFSEGVEARAIDPNRPETLLALEQVPALLLYEESTTNAVTDEVRYGRLSGIHVVERTLVFRFHEEGRFTRATFRNFATRLGVTDNFEHHRTHWAIKDGGIPRDMIEQLRKTYDVALSFAGANRDYVEQVAAILRAHGVRVFFDSFEEAALWGEHLGEILADVYERRARYCVMFISRSYAEREWTRHERRAALDRALRDRRPYILPCRFDDTQLAGVSSSLSYVQLDQKTPVQLATLILEKLG